MAVRTQEAECRNSCQGCEDMSSIPEVAGNAALLVNPLDASQIAEAMGKVLCDEKLRSDLFEKGLQRAHFFTWEGAARAAPDIHRNAYDASDQGLVEAER